MNHLQDIFEDQHVPENQKTQKRGKYLVGYKGNTKPVLPPGLQDFPSDEEIRKATILIKYLSIPINSDSLLGKQQ